MDKYEALGITNEDMKIAIRYAKDVQKFHAGTQRCGGRGEARKYRLL